ncbi:MAG TPA: rhodanese-like domain-containing protein [Opitutus sp.]|nr:rhodanese-like domain-containing protein [Opitutus sp.]
MKKLILALAACALGASLAFAATVAKISPVDAAQRAAASTAVLIDVREPAEWSATGVAAPAVLLPMSDFKGAQKLWKPFLEKNAGKELILYCRTGHRAGIVGEQLAAAGRTVANAGGFRDWTAAKLPVRQP